MAAACLVAWLAFAVVPLPAFVGPAGMTAPLQQVPDAAERADHTAPLHQALRTDAGKFALRHTGQLLREAREAGPSSNLSPPWPKSDAMRLADMREPGAAWRPATGPRVRAAAPLWTYAARYHPRAPPA